MAAIRLSELTANQTEYLDLKKALAHAGRARCVETRKPDRALEKIARIYKLSLGGNPPPWIGELRHLRVLKLFGRVTEIPTSVFELPNLEELYLEEANVSAGVIAGIARSSSLRTVCFGELGDERPEEVEALIEKIPGAKLDFIGLAIPRKPRPVPKGKAALVKAIAADTLDPAGVDLRKTDLRGVVIEDAFASSWDLRGADLSGSVWRRCDLWLVKLDGANLEGATFEDCTTDDVTMTKAKARGLTFRRCELGVDLKNADVHQASFTELEPSPRIELEGAKAQGLVLEAKFHHESEINISAKKADLRGARVTFDVVDQRRKELSKEKNPRVRWAKGHFDGVKQDGATSLVYTPLPGSKDAGAKAPKPLVDERGAGAEALVRIDAINAALWLLAIDGAAAAAWNGTDEEEFDRALDEEEGPFEVGESRGVLAQIGDCGWSWIFGIDGGFALTCQQRSGHAAKMPKAEYAKALGRRVSQLPVPAKPDRIGTFTVTSGCIALMLPYTRGDFTAAQLEGARKKVVSAGGDRVLVPAPNGTYEVVAHAWGPKGYEDELGRYESVTRIIRTGAKAAKPSAPAKNGKARRFELVDGTSSKFWEIRLEGTSFTTTYGKIGTSGQSTTKSWPSPDKARTEHDKLVAEKTKKGYRETR